MNAKQAEAVAALDPAERVKHLVSKVADFEEVWGLRNNGGWVLSRTPDGREAFPIWPHPEYAKVCATAEWSDCEPGAIELHQFMDAWLPGLAMDGKVVAVFPTQSSGGVPLSSAQFEAMLRAELERIE